MKKYTCLQMSAYRFAKLHSIPVRKHIEYKYFGPFHELSFRTPEYEGSLTTLNKGVRPYKGITVVISLGYFSSQILKNIVIWHELGHYMDRLQVGYNIYYNKFSILKREARASMIAIRMMKRYGHFNEIVRENLLGSYRSYSQAYQFRYLRDYEYLIRET